MMFMVSKPEPAKARESNDPECPFCSLKFLSDADLQKHNNDFHSMDVNETSMSDEKPTYTNLQITYVFSESRKDLRKVAQI